MAYLIVFFGAGLCGAPRHFVNVVTQHLGNQSWASPAVHYLLGFLAGSGAPV